MSLSSKMEKIIFKYKWFSIKCNTIKYESYNNKKIIFKWKDPISFLTVFLLSPFLEIIFSWKQSHSSLGPSLIHVQSPLFWAWVPSLEYFCFIAQNQELGGCMQLIISVPTLQSSNHILSFASSLSMQIIRPSVMGFEHFLTNFAIRSLVIKWSN